MTNPSNTTSRSVRRRTAVSALALAAAVVASIAPLSAQTPGYVVASVATKDLGTLGGSESVANDINDVGWVVGWSRDASGLRRAFLDRGAGMENIGASLSKLLESEARGVNRWGSIVGTLYQVADGAALPRAFYWNKRWRLLDDAPGTGLPGDCYGTSEAAAINEHDAITGRIGERLRAGSPGPCASGSKAARWTSPSAVPERFDFTYPNAFGRDIDEAGTILARVSSIGSSLSYLQRGGVSILVPRPTPVPGRTYEDRLPGGLNKAGAVSGSVLTYVGTPGAGPLSMHAFVWDGTSPGADDLGLLPTGLSTYGNGLNDGGFVAGYGDVVTETIRHNVGYLYHPSFGLHALPRLKASGPSGSCAASALNELHGNTGLIQVVGWCQVDAGEVHAVRWDIHLTALP